MKFLLFPILAMVLFLSVMAFANNPAYGLSVSFVSSFGNTGVGDGRLEAPEGIALDSSGNLYVADPHNHRIAKFDSTGHFITQIGIGHLSFPTNVVVDNSRNIYVLDNNLGIEKFNSSGGFVSKFGAYGMNDAKQKVPVGIAVDTFGNVYITDFSIIQKYNSTGSFVSKFGSWGMKDGQLNSTGDMILDSSGNIYVADGNERVEKFSNDGTFITKWGSYCSINDYHTFATYCHDPDSSGHLDIGDIQFSNIEGIALDNSGNVFVTDMGNNRVQIFDPSGNFLYKFGSFGTGNAQFNDPNGMAVDNSGNMYVVDQGNNRVQIFHINYGDMTGASSNIVVSHTVPPTPPKPTCILPQVLSSDGTMCFTPPPAESSAPQPAPQVTQTTMPTTEPQVTQQATQTTTPSTEPQKTQSVPQPIMPPVASAVPVPAFVKNYAKEWSTDEIATSDFSSSIKYMMVQKIITLPQTSTPVSSSSIPTWMKDTAKWWANGEISDNDFVSVVQYLVNQNIIKIKN
jgi:sugar lactone lactonase YvrE